MLRRDFIKAGIAGVMASQVAACASKSAKQFASLEAQFDANRQPSADRQPVGYKPAFTVTDFGAVGDAKQLNTKAIQAAIDAAASSADGGSVVIPKGTFLTGTLTLASKVELHLEKGATLLGSTNVYDYERSARGWLTLLRAYQANDVAITGQGTIDGQGRQTALAIDHLHHSGQRVMHNYNNRRMRPNEAERPEIIELVECNDVKIYDINVFNSASWVQTYYNCTHLHIDNIKVVSDAYWNNDGIDIDNVKHAKVTNCFVNAADDAICIKSEKNALLNEDIYVGNCIVRSSSNGVKFGTSSHTGFKNVTIENIKAFDTYRSAVCIGCVDGGSLDRVSVNNVHAVNTGNGFVIRLGHRNTEGEVGSLKNVSIKNLYAEIPFVRADLHYDLRGPALNKFFNPIPASVTGLPGHNVENVELENIILSYPGIANKGLAYIPLDQLFQVPEERDEYPEYTMFGELPGWGLYVRHATNVALKNVKVVDRDADFRPAFVFDDVTTLSVKNSRVASTQVHPHIVVNNVKGYQLSGNKQDNAGEVEVLSLGNSSSANVNVES